MKFTGIHGSIIKFLMLQGALVEISRPEGVTFDIPDDKQNTVKMQVEKDS